MSPAKSTTKKTALKPSKSTPAKGQTSTVWTDEEKAAMRETAQERKATASKEAGEEALLAKIAQMKEPDRGMAKRLHAIITTNAPSLWPKTWYGMPAYATPGKDGKVVCYFQDAAKFKARYATFGFNDVASLDEGTMWATCWALTKLTPADEARIAALVKKAVS